MQIRFGSARRSLSFSPVPALFLAEKLAKSTASEEPIMMQYQKLCNGAALPTDDAEVAKALLEDLMKQMTYGR